MARGRRGPHLRTPRGRRRVRRGLPRAPDWCGRACATPGHSLAAGRFPAAGPSRASPPGTVVPRGDFPPLVLPGECRRDRSPQAPNKRVWGGWTSADDRARKPALRRVTPGAQGQHPRGTPGARTAPRRKRGARLNLTRSACRWTATASRHFRAPAGCAAVLAAAPRGGGRPRTPGPVGGSTESSGPSTR